MKEIRVGKSDGQGTGWSRQKQPGKKQEDGYWQEKR